MAADKGKVFLFQKITIVWLTGNGKDKRVALEIGFKCYLGDDGQTMLQALPALLLVFSYGGQPVGYSQVTPIPAGFGRHGCILPVLEHNRV